MRYFSVHLQPSGNLSGNFAFGAKGRLCERSRLLIGPFVASTLKNRVTHPTLFACRQ